MKKLILIFSIIFIVMGVYLFDSSYRLSLEARYYFEKGDYDKAYQLATEAYKMKKYNNMAFMVMTQSKIAKEWVNYINEADNYFDYINRVTNQDYISDSEKVRIKIMLEILIERFPYLTDSKLVDEKLYEKMAQKYLKAKKIYEKVFGKRVK